MAPARIVVDTNILVSAMISVTRGRWSPELNLIARILEASLKSPVLLLSPPIVLEYEEVLGRPKFKTMIDSQEAAGFIQRLKIIGDWIRPETTVRLTDRSDEKFLECALDGRADYLVTDNKKDFPDWTFIVNIREFWEDYAGRE